MSLRLYNTMSREKEEFVPLEPGRVRMYVCGVTVYDECHIGHARSQIVFDTVARYLRHKGFTLSYARNFTDIDDKIINRANERKIDWKELVAENVEAFYRDMDALAVQRPDLEPRATDNIDAILEQIGQIMKNGYAYEAGGDVFFRTRKFEGYAKLSKRNLDDLLEGARVEVDKRKKDPLDFVLWKAAKPGEPSWPSPWGEGRPGWHIECSAMSAKHLGLPFDIHGGGKDLVFPHHENEIAQAECATNTEFARYWMHNGFVQYNHEKMSKSTGNLFTIREVLEKYSPEAVRYLLLSVHYRGPLDYSEQSIIDSEAAVDRLYAAYETLLAENVGDIAVDESQLSDAQKAQFAEIERARREFFEAMDDDFNTAKASGHLFEIVKFINACVETKELRKPRPGRDMLLSVAGKAFEEMRAVLGVAHRAPEDYRRDKVERFLREAPITREQIEQKIAQRTDARAAKDFAASDAIRDELAAQGVIVKDTPDGTVWTVK